MEFEREHDLPYSPEQIWAVLGDFENHRIWNPYVRIERLGLKGSVDLMRG